MTSRSLLSKWLVEYTSPVVVTVATAEAEAICLKNGLLFHELLSAFGHLDNLSATVRSVNHQIPVIDAHIRFERVSEVVPKSSGCIEEILRDSFVAYDIEKLPHTPDELKSSPPSGWTSKIEQTLMRSMSFSEFEMSSHPLIFLTVVASSDVDHIACMHELSSVHHLPACFGTGQYDPDIHRVYLLLHDNSSGHDVDTSLLLRQLKSKFSPTHTKLLCINSLPEDNPNLHHPDIWARWRIPLFFPQHAPQSPTDQTSPVNPETNTPVVGTRLSMEDYMSLRTFCIELFQQEVLPAYERRVGVLLRHVNEARKGVRNVLKSFWRKPRDNSSHMKGVARYKHDRIEAQILLLGDTAFSMRDYEAALSMYRLVKDDFKADKSNLHIAHTNLMMAACQFMLEPGVRTREVGSYVESIGACISMNSELPHASAYYAFILSEILTANASNKSPLEAVQVLLQAAGSVSRLPMLSALLTERAAQYCLPARQDRKYSLHVVLAGHKFNSCGVPAAVSHASVCFAAAMVLHDPGAWGTVKSRLWRALADKLKRSGSADGARKALLLLLQILSAVSSNGKTYSGTVALVDAVNVYHELIHESFWGNMSIPSGWEDVCTRDILLDKTQYTDQTPRTRDCKVDLETAVDLIDSNSSCSPPIDSGLTVVEDLRIPEVFMPSVVLMVPLNGSACAVPHGTYSSLHSKIDLLKSLLEVEKSLEKSFSSVAEDDLLLQTCAERFILTNMSARSDNSRSLGTHALGGSSKGLMIPLGEKVIIQMHINNPLPVELSLKDFKIIMNSPDCFDVTGVDVVLPSGASKVLTLYATPLNLGSFHVEGVSWYLGDKVKVVQHIRKEGPLLQKTLSQRAVRERGQDRSLMFNIVETCPSIQVEIGESINNTEILSGEVINTTIVLHNEGGADGKDIDLIFNYPVSAVELYNESEGDESESVQFLPFFGQSCTAVHLPAGIEVRPGDSVTLRAWVRLQDPGIQEIQVLASYKSKSSERSSTRMSFSSFQVTVLPSIDISMSVVARQSSSTSKSILLELANRIPTDEMASNYGIVTPIQASSDVPEAMNRGGNGCCCVSGILFLGAGELAGTIIGATTGPGNEKCIANISEKLSLYLPVELASAADMLDPNPPIGESWFCSPDVSTRISPVFEMFTFMSFCTNRLLREMERARNRIRESELNGSEQAPRLISQVRKERNIKAASNTSSANDSGYDSPCRGISDVGPFSTGPPSNPGVRRNENSCEYSTDALMSTVARSEMKRGEATVAVAWACHWKGQLHHGISILHRQHLFRSTGLENDSSASIPLPASPVRKLSPGTVSGENPSDMLGVGFKHPQSITWDFSKGRCPVSVMLELHSTSSVPLVVYVEALEWIDMPSNRSSSRRRRPPVKGLHWEGKSRYVGVLISPQSTVQLPFLALISRKGVYDVKRFRVAVSLTNDETSSPTIKVLQGQSLVAVVEENVIEK
mmetsp:Transcript_14452/g.21723  ORF Transcript_14452/g.21723 Transcript_14452/m.21723 type:complete len:1460 (-) Transcript_14452:198-4577(-)